MARCKGYPISYTLYPVVARYKGVALHKQSGRWVAQIKAARQAVYLGFYHEPEAAAEAYDQALILLKARACDISPRGRCAVNPGTWA